MAADVNKAVMNEFIMPTLGLTIDKPEEAFVEADAKYQ